MITIFLPFSRIASNLAIIIIASLGVGALNVDVKNGFDVRMVTVGNGGGSQRSTRLH